MNEDAMVFLSWGSFSFPPGLTPLVVTGKGGGGAHPTLSGAGGSGAFNSAVLVDKAHLLLAASDTGQAAERKPLAGDSAASQSADREHE
ncbi:hypothetical protein [Arsenicitalea aurantiaca]|uniref:hypothetical protein n=1 Tax=Arsenicitalea aurantiaca TaxID=1783274 RepID=UPI00131526E1|nr:hypothetical protein [Arsenicitalea aurantiaca]